MHFVRTIRTATSERYLIQGADGKDNAALDLHYLADGSVAGTLVVLDKSLGRDEEIHRLLAKIDETLLPTASLDAKNLAFTVVLGKVVGAFSAERD